MCVAVVRPRAGRSRANACETNDRKAVLTAYRYKHLLAARRSLRLLASPLVEDALKSRRRPLDVRRGLPRGLGAGADGYLTKPFDRFELLANLDAIIRRTHGHSSATVSVGNLEVDLNRHLALIGGKPLPLTGKESRIVEFLTLRKGSVLSKTAFLSHLYDGMDKPEPKIIDVFICKLRRKLELAGASGVSIDTVWGQGYILRETEAVKPAPGSLPANIENTRAAASSITDANVTELRAG